MQAKVLSTIAPTLPDLRLHPASSGADWARWLKAWRGPDPAQSCPQCGGGMVRRKGKHGPFLGCSAYPDCKGTRPAPPVSQEPLEGQPCPLQCGGEMRQHITERGARKLRCNKCNSFDHARYLTHREKAQASQDKKDKRAAKGAATAKKADKARKADGLQREMVLQLPADGFDYREWFGEGWNDE